MARFESVIAFSNKCKANLNRLDIVVLNAGLAPAKYKKTGDGWEVSRFVPTQLDEIAKSVDSCL